MIAGTHTAHTTTQGPLTTMPTRIHTVPRRHHTMILTTDPIKSTRLEKIVLKPMQIDIIRGQAEDERLKKKDRYHALLGVEVGTLEMTILQGATISGV